MLINVKVFNLVSRTNETRYIEWYETCKCKCTLDASVCNNKQRWNDDKCRCECKKLIDKGVCDLFGIQDNTDDNLPLNKPLKMRMLAIIVRSVFEEDGKFYPHVYLDRCLYEL